MAGPAGCYQKAVEEDDVTALKFGDLDRGDKFNGCLSMDCLLYTSPSPRDMRRSRMPSSA